jgi:hypothetical protein
LRARQHPNTIGSVPKLSIPLQISELYDLLQTEVVWMHGRWACYRQLFAASDRRIDLLNECASAFFFIIQDVLLDEIQVSLSKLTDPASSLGGKYPNLSLEQLQAQLDAHGDAHLAAANRKTLDLLHTQCQVFREWRNKKLAHLDLATAKKSSPNPIPGVSRQMIEDALKTLREYLNAIEAHYNDSEMGYEQFLMSSDGDALVGVLREGLRYEELMKEGKVPFDDWRQGKWHDA